MSENLEGVTKLGVGFPTGEIRLTTGEMVMLEEGGKGSAWGSLQSGALTGSKETTDGISTTLVTCTENSSDNGKILSDGGKYKIHLRYATTLIFLPSCSPSPLLAAQAMRFR